MTRVIIPQPASSLPSQFAGVTRDCCHNWVCSDAAVQTSWTVASVFHTSTNETYERLYQARRLHTTAASARAFGCRRPGLHSWRPQCSHPRRVTLPGTEGSSQICTLETETGQEPLMSRARWLAVMIQRMPGCRTSHVTQASCQTCRHRPRGSGVPRRRRRRRGSHSGITARVHTRRSCWMQTRRRWSVCPVSLRRCRISGTASGGCAFNLKPNP